MMCVWGFEVSVELPAAKKAEAVATKKLLDYCLLSRMTSRLQRRDSKEQHRVFRCLGLLVLFRTLGLGVSVVEANSSQSRHVRASALGTDPSLN